LTLFAGHQEDYLALEKIEHGGSNATPLYLASLKSWLI